MTAQSPSLQVAFCYIQVSVCGAWNVIQLGSSWLVCQPLYSHQLLALEARPFPVALCTWISEMKPHSTLDSHSLCLYLLKPYLQPAQRSSTPLTGSCREGQGEERSLTVRSLAPVLPELLPAGSTPPVPLVCSVL